jgi:hypothetical protein
VKQNLNEYTRHKSLILSDVETTIMEIFKQTYVFETRYGMKVEEND